ncbi:protein-glutamine glutaminase family protein [Ruegeria sp. HKCCD8929]|uniref:protein-glutamine glutaminase family protein n=1 Tax=Ruegeria sp. HKCCD8929 TaxID=2683006 RepID=UPI0014878566|nr:protein-glutamine glutaminase family protein [Ruegeria sp. HKCCD8929]
MAETSSQSRFIVDYVVDIDPKIERPVENLFSKGGPKSYIVKFADGGQAVVTRSEHAALHLDLLDDLMRAKQPVYAALDEAGESIIDILLPMITRVLVVTANIEGDVEVSLETSHARHFLRRKNPDFDSLLVALSDESAADSLLFVTETDDHEIVDVRPFRGGALTLDFSYRSPARRVLKWIRDRLYPVYQWFLYWFFCWFRRYTVFNDPCVSLRRAQELFALVASKNCPPLTASAPCIPFMYPDDGCWARAHEMCRLMIADGASPAKVWISGSLRAASKNNPNCEVLWGWHVAPTLCVRDLYCRKITYVIDPSLFTGPVTKAVWASVQGDPSPSLRDSPWTEYSSWQATDSTFVHTNNDLDTYRRALRLRSGGGHGPPPYAHC